MVLMSTRSSSGQLQFLHILVVCHNSSLDHSLSNLFDRMDRRLNMPDCDAETID
jgi:hypothetical protein